ncbi:MAG: Xylose isomerase [Alphaproteobacteria bacterium MarineAlpha5_Bin6]|nr:MAG: Xylose isomerase [Alphaproteobacteria bacterium MarineAlpha5_Bin7]PPR52942.1 MAG: Xylose isomerase [Alphaproteobacteria bacterium MarineAlpha5_Bin6]|tara:strand:+ start:986 stop:1966 length:981 start_codon:yes stop_codon:yes gene_type:complete
MLGSRFAARLNSFSSKPELFWEGKSTIETIDLINRAATVKGLTDIDLNYPDHTKKNFLDIISCLKDSDLNINGLAMRYYDNPAFKLGAFTHPDKKIRQEAIDLTKNGIDCARETGCNLMTLWLGQDGFDYSFQADYKDLWQKEIEAIHEVALHDPECKISIEYKPNEPRAYSLLPNLTSTLLAISEIGLKNLGVTLDFAHLLYANEQPAFAAAMVSKKSQLLGVHLNDAYGKRDDGLMVGSVHFHATVEFLYQIIQDGYDGVIYFDTFPNITDLDPVNECQTNIETVKKILKIAHRILKDKKFSESIQIQDPITTQQIFFDSLKNE